MQWARSAAIVLAAVLALGGARYAERSHREAERVEDFEQTLDVQAQGCAESAAAAVPYEPAGDRPLFSRHFVECMEAYDPNHDCELSILIRWCTGPGGSVDIGRHADSALEEATGQPFIRPGEIGEHGEPIDDSLPIPPPALTGSPERPLAQSVPVRVAAGMEGEAMWIRGVLVAQPDVGDRVVLCPQVERIQDGVVGSVHCELGLVPEDGVIWTDAERSFVGTIEDGAPRIVRWTGAPELMPDCVFDDHRGTLPAPDVRSCRDLESRYGQNWNFFTLYTEVYGRVAEKPRDAGLTLLRAKPRS